KTPLGLQPRYEDLEWAGLESFSRARFEELTRIEPEVWRKEVTDHAELFDKLKSRMPKELYALREQLERAL
ncbi:MAG TPA: phosphoenolpyruvate carboxykinase domain-containing protein, partial [Burkholderiales bacterium]